MPRLITPLVLLLLAASLTAQDSKPLTSGGEDFHADVYARLAAAETGNIVYSPWSLRTALAMTRPGARSTTAEELDRVLRLPRNQEALGRLFAEVEADIASRGRAGRREIYGFETSNRVWPDRSEKLLASYQDALRDHWNAPAIALDFRGNAEAARQRINAEVAKATHDVIKELLDSGDVDGSTRLVLTNALWLKASWRDPFKKPARPAAFHGPDGKIMTSMMSGLRNLRYGENESLQAAAIPLRGRGLEFVVLLPKKRDGLAALEKGLDGKRLRTLMKMLDGRPQFVQVELPKFKIESNSSMRDVLIGMGLKNAFSSRADFGGMSVRKGLFISDVVQGASIDLDENGLEAAAATAVIMKRGGVRPSKPTATLRCNHPFLWMVRDRVSGSILFAGRLAKPAPVPEAAKSDAN